MRILTFLVLSIALSLNAHGGQQSKERLAHEYLRISKVEDTINASLQTYAHRLMQNGSPQDRQALAQIMQQAMGWEVIKDDVAAIVMDIYTTEELEASINFMKSPVGASVTAKNEVFSQAFSRLVAENMQRVIHSMSGQAQ